MDQNSTAPETFRRLIAWAVTPALLVALAAGCSDDSSKVSAGSGDSSSTTATTGTTSSLRAQSTTTPSGATTTKGATRPAMGSATTAGSTPPADDPRVTAARQDLQRRFGYDPADIKVVSVESVTWPTTALGCPATGKMYAQTLVEGYRIVLAWKTTNFRYHGANGEVPFLCEFLD